MEIRPGHRLYVICMRDHAYYLVGPFEDYDALQAWGRHEADHGDDPRWQSVQLRDTALEPLRVDAAWHPGYTP